MTDIQQVYEEVVASLSSLSTPDRLRVIANLIFDGYPEYQRLDVLYKGIEKQDLKLLDNFRELEEAYHFNKDSYVFLALNAAHDLLLVSGSIENELKKSI